MGKRNMLVLVLLFTITYNVFSQSNEKNPGATDNDAMRAKMAANAQRPDEDKSDVVEISGTGNISFKVSNLTDGTVNAYNHSHLIFLPLITTSGKMNYQFVFYGVHDKLLYSVETEGSKTTIYYPIGMYDEIKKKLEQSMNQKKKVVMKLVQKTDGYRECVLQF